MSFITNKINPYGGDISHTVQLIDNDDTARDITALVIEFNIYESIFNQTLSADLVIRDSIGIIDGQSPLTGQEFILITFNSSNSGILGASLKFLFKVHKVGSKIELNPGTTAFTLNCASAELEDNLTKTVDITYKDKLGSDVAYDIFKQYIDFGDKNFDYEETDNVVPYTAVGQTPFEALDVIAKECRSRVYKDASHYLFFETAQGFRFRTLSSLLSQTPADDAVYYFSDPGAPNAPPKERLIIGHTFLDSVDTIASLGNGLYDNSTSVIDPITKRFEKSRFNYANDFGKLPHISGGGKPTLNLNKSKVLGSEIPESGHGRLQVGDLTSIAGSDPTFDNRITANSDPYIFHGRERYRKTPLVAAQLASLRQHGIDITVPLNLNINAGDIVQLFIPAAKDRRTELAFIEHYGPNPTFLVTSISTKMSVNGDYFTSMQCVKESFAIDLRGRPIEFTGAQGLMGFSQEGLKYSTQLLSDVGYTTDLNINAVAGVVSGVTSIANEELSAISDKAVTDATEKATDAISDADTDTDATDTDATSQSEALDTAADEIATKSEELAKEAVKNIADAAVATGVALVTSKILTSINVSPAKLAKIVAVIKLLEKIPIFKGPVTDVKADIAATKDQVTSTIPGGGD